MSFPAQAQKTSHRHGLYTHKKESPHAHCPQLSAAPMPVNPCHCPYLSPLGMVAGGTRRVVLACVATCTRSGSSSLAVAASRG